MVHFVEVNPMPKAGGKWNTYEIIAKGRQITVVLNGEKTAEFHNGLFAEGPFTLQHGDEGATDAKTHHQELRDAQVIHQAEVVVGVRVPGPVDLEWTGRLAAVGVAQVRRDAAVLVLELIDRVERRIPGEEADGRVQTPTGDEEQWEARARLLVVDADVALFVKRHGSFSLEGCERSQFPRR
jgi:hypothetical protein